MFYVKQQLDSETSLSINITESNVYTKCATCGREIEVDLVNALRTNHENDLEHNDCQCLQCLINEVREGLAEIYGVKEDGNKQV